MPFKDLFSKQAATYAQYRPTYPDALFAYLAELAPDHQLAWDCGTGSGQAACSLTQHFKQVIATDASHQQLAHATPCPHVRYWVAMAEAPGIQAASADLVTVAEAVHWFDLERFFQTVTYTLRDKGIIALWCYHHAHLSPDLDPILVHYYEQILGPFWSPRVHWVNEHYQTLPFPFNEVTPPPFEARAMWSLDNLLGFLRSWSAAQSYIEHHHHDPLELIRAELTTAWGATPYRLIRWPLHLRVGSKQNQPTPTQLAR